MQRIGLGLTILLIALLAGCGGGGGGTAISSSPSMEISDDILGAWKVENLDLPNDEIIVNQNGTVSVEVADSETRSDTASTVCIGSCSSAGVLSLNGTWTNNGIEHTINASGSIDTSSNKLSLVATVKTDSETICQNLQTTGTKCDDSSDESEDEDIDTPPAPPSMDTEEDIDTPPAPPL